MKILCLPSVDELPKLANDQLPVLLFGRADPKLCGSVGAAVEEEIRRMNLIPAPQAWDLLSLALSVIAADQAVLRETSPDGWTRAIDLEVAVNDPPLWSAQAEIVERMCRFLTTDIWSIKFVKGRYVYDAPKRPRYPDDDCVALLSGGVDSLVGTIDLVSAGKRPFGVSQIVQGEAEEQRLFASEIAGGLRHLQMNHNAQCPGQNERSQRSRSIIFLAYGVLAATTMAAYRDGERITLYVSENGFISINPPLTNARLGSLSTRTAHPVFLSLFQTLLNNVGLEVEVVNKYRFKTKGQMLCECTDQTYLKRRAHQATSCGRYARYGFQHCGRCLPCQIRRAAFHRWGEVDRSGYVYKKLGKRDSDHAAFDDVRSAAMALATLKAEGLDSLLGGTLSSPLIDDPDSLRDVVLRGFIELEEFLTSMGVS